MRALRTLLLLVPLLVSLSAREAATISSYADQETKLNATLEQVGDFRLCDLKGEAFQYGRILLDFASVFEVLAKAPLATGECEFMHARVLKEGKDKPALHKLRYFFRFEDSVLYLNSDHPTEEIKLTVDFDPAKDILTGSIVIDEPKGPKEVGLFQLRIQDPKAQP